MQVAFYAPMKPPGADVPSGDLVVARGLIRALEHAGHDVDVPVRLRTWQAEPDGARQRRLAEVGAKLAGRLVRRFKSPQMAEQGPDIWFTYHLYYKAPDWIGPAVADALGIPYVVAEASHAPKRAGGPWDVGHRAAEAAIRRADLVFGLNSSDSGCVLPLLDDPARLVPLKPFLIDAEPPPPGEKERARAVLADRFGLDPSQPWLLTVAMMRDDAKLESYRVLARALSRLQGHAWQHLVAGDGPAAGAVQNLFDPDRTVFTGRLAENGLAVLRAAADIYVWPAIREAYGMSILEAQFHGLPVVAGAAGGVADVVHGGGTGILKPEGDDAAFAEAVQTLLEPERRQTMSIRAREVAMREHGPHKAAATIGQALEGLRR